MCTVDNIKVDEAVLRGLDSELSSPEAIGRWVQELVDSRIAEMQAIREQQFVEVDINAI